MIAGLLATLSVASGQPDAFGLAWGMTPEDAALNPEFDLYWREDDEYDFIRKSCDTADCSERLVLNFGEEGLSLIYHYLFCQTDSGCQDDYDAVRARIVESYGPHHVEPGFAFGLNMGYRLAGVVPIDPRLMPHLYWHRHETEVLVSAFSAPDDGVAPVVTTTYEHSGPSTADAVEAGLAWWRNNKHKLDEETVAP